MDENPTMQAGLLLCENDFRKRIVHVWHYKDDPKKLFTNEDGAAPVNDEIYNDVEWKGPIEIDI
jgi:hypothetical protein